MTDSLSQALDASLIEGLALDKQPTGYTASVFLGLQDGEGKWSPRVFASDASEAVRKALGALPVPVAEVVQESPAPSLAPPPY